MMGTNFSQSLKKSLWSGFRAAVNFWKFKVAQNPLHKSFINFEKSCNLAYYNSITKMGFTELVFWVFSRTNFSQSLKKSLWSGFTAAVNFWKFKVALNPLHKSFINFEKSCNLAYYNSITKMGFTELVFWVFSRSYCCYGNLLYKEDDCHLFTNDWAFVWCWYCSITY